MPRNRSRFSDLERQFRQSGGVAAPGSALAKYIDFKSGKTKINRRKDTKLTAGQRKRYGVSLQPFNLDFPATPTQGSRYIASINGFSDTGRKAVGLSDAELGYDKQTAGGVTAQTDPTYYPALLKIAVPTGKAAVSVTSSITGTKYMYTETNSYSVPFGRTAAGDSEQERRGVLTAKAKNAATPPSSVGYEPEVFRGNRSPLDELGA